MVSQPPSTTTEVGSILASWEDGARIAELETGARLAELEAEVAQHHDALTHRRLIEHAIGLVMITISCSTDARAEPAEGRVGVAQLAAASSPFVPRDDVCKINGGGHTDGK